MNIREFCDAYTVKSNEIFSNGYEWFMSLTIGQGIAVLLFASIVFWAVFGLFIDRETEEVY